MTLVPWKCQSARIYTVQLTKAITDLLVCMTLLPWKLQSAHIYTVQLTIARTDLPLCDLHLFPTLKMELPFGWWISHCHNNRRHLTNRWNIGRNLIEFVSLFQGKQNATWEHQLQVHRSCRFSGLWVFRLRTSGLWHHVVLQVDPSVLEEHIASIFESFLPSGQQVFLKHRHPPIRLFIVSNPDAQRVKGRNSS
jgi:hypothetical protein